MLENQGHPPLDRLLKVNKNGKFGNIWQSASLYIYNDNRYNDDDDFSAIKGFSLEFILTCRRLLSFQTKPYQALLRNKETN